MLIRLRGAGEEEDDIFADKPRARFAKEIGNLLAKTIHQGCVANAGFLDKLAERGLLIIFTIFHVSLGIIPVSAVVEQQVTAG